MKIENIKLVTYFQRKYEQAQRNEQGFENLNQLKQYIKNCGGIKSFKWDEEDSKCMYFIVGEYEGNECYYEYKFGKYSWYDCNGYEIR